jgi:hypothetical protein
MLTNLGSVIRGTENQFWCTVVPRANVGHIWFVFYQNLRTTKVTELQNAGRGVEQEVLRLDVAMADSLRVNVGEGAKELVDVELDFQDGHSLLELAEVP